jgi:phage shock protein E
MQGRIGRIGDCCGWRHEIICNFGIARGSISMIICLVQPNPMKPNGTMNWILPVIVALVVVGFLILRQRGAVSVPEARRLLGEGALLVDVRTAGEFAAGSVPGAVNVPLSDLPGAIAKHAPDKSRVLLVHCQSGGRSAIAAMKLRSAGYSRVFNVGSFSQAQQVAASSAGH